MTRVTAICLGFFLGLAAVTAAAPQPPADNPSPLESGGKSYNRFLALKKRVGEHADAQTVFIGDSITHYWETSGRAVWQESFGDKNALNLGIEGIRTHHVLWMLESGLVDDLSPSLVVVLIGTNNIGLSKQSSDETLGGIRAVVERLHAKLPNSHILLLGLLPRGKPGRWPRTEVEAVNAQIPDLVQKPWGTYLNLGPRYLTANGELKEGATTDGLHLSTDGYRIWAQALQEYQSKQAE